MGANLTSQAPATRRGRPRVGDFVWHIHHDKLCEPLTEPFAKRIEYIKATKPANEIATRLRWMTAVRGKLPGALYEAQAVHDKAGAVHDKAGAACNEARAAYNEAWDACNEALAAYNEAWDAYNEAQAAYNEAWDAYNKARAAYNEAWAAYNEAWDAYNKARAAALPALNRLHAKEHPGCPWNGRTLFP